MKDRRLHQRGGQHSIQVVDALKASLEHATSQLSSVDVKSWDRVLRDMRREYGDDGVWETFQLMRKKKYANIFARPDAESLRDVVLAAALDTDSRIAEVVELAQGLSAHEESPWPHLYYNVIHHLLSHAYYDDAVLWHLRLAPQFPPGTEALKELLVYFITDPTEKMQSSLTTMYILNTERRLYDHIVTTLFASGHSQLARTWRKTLLNFQDFPSTSDSLPFLNFLQSYYPVVQLADEEKAVSGFRKQPGISYKSVDRQVPALDRPNGIYTDSIVAKWFASSWTSVEFAINLVHRLGIQTIGPRSLQSLALREADAEGVSGRIAQLKNLGVTLPDQLYSMAIVMFANRGETTLLSYLLRCDVHPDEFDDPNTRRMLLAAAVRDGNKEMQLLLQSIDGIESITEVPTRSHPLNSLLVDELTRGGLVKANVVLDRMEAMHIAVEQELASRILHRAFLGITGSVSHGIRKSLDTPDDDAHDPDMSEKPNQAVLNRAIATTLQMARMGVAIRVRDWQTLLKNLAWSTRLAELEQLSLDILDLYGPQHGCLLSVHQADVPDSVAHISKKPSSKEEQRQLLRDRNRPNVKQLLPADLPMSHPQHPVRKIFDIPMLRKILRWGFTKTAAVALQSHSSFIDMSTAKPEHFDVARGVRLLAMMRDQGVVIDKQVLRVIVVRQIVLLQLPTRSHHTRDSHAMRPEALKRLVDLAWGSEFLSKSRDFTQEMEKEERKLWKQYPVLFGKNFDRDNFEQEYQTRRKPVDDEYAKWFKARRRLE